MMRWKGDAKREELFGGDEEDGGRAGEPSDVDGADAGEAMDRNKRYHFDNALKKGNLDIAIKKAWEVYFEISTYIHTKIASVHCFQATIASNV